MEYYYYGYKVAGQCVNNYAWLTSRAPLIHRHVSHQLYVSVPRFNSGEGASETLKIHFKSLYRAGPDKGENWENVNQRRDSYSTNVIPDRQEPFKLVDSRQ